MRATFSPIRHRIVRFTPLIMLLSACLLSVWCGNAAGQGDTAALTALGDAYGPSIQPLLRAYCHECHSAKLSEAEISFESIGSFTEVRRTTKIWQRVAEVVNSHQMPPKDAKQPTDAERQSLQRWVHDYLTVEAQVRAGDPGPVVLRRLSNAEYTYTIRDLTHVPTLDPAREFPVDGAAGEGFTNTGGALVMSPALVTKYLDAAKEVASHAILLPDGFRFSPLVTPSDRTNNTLARIRGFYRRFTDSAGGDKVNLQGIVFDTNQGGRLPIETYLAATLRHREAIKSGRKSIEDVARETGLSPKYLGGLWQVLNADPSGARPSESKSLLLDPLRIRWRDAQRADAAALTADIARWQQALWKFTSVGHIGKLNGPKAWMEPVSPILARQELRQKLSPSADAKDLVLYLFAGDAGDGNENDFVIWERPRLVAPGRPDLLLRDIRAVTAALASRRQRIFDGAAQCLTAAAEASAAQDKVNLPSLAKKHQVDPESLAAWLDYLGIGAGGPVKLGTPISRKIESASGYAFIQGWVGDDALSVVANSSDQHVRIPGNMKPHSIAVHPAPTLSVAIGWRSPVQTALRIEGVVQHAHPECGNGVAWTLELRRGNTRQRLAAGNSQGATPVPFGPLEKVTVQVGDVIALLINPRDANHSCDLTALDLTLRDDSREWSLAQDVSPDILAGNPHPDRLGHADVWNFFSEPASGSVGQVIPAGSSLAKWQSAGSADEKKAYADALQRLLREGPAALPKDAPDQLLYQQLTSMGGPLLSAALLAIAANPGNGPGSGPSGSGGTDAGGTPFGLDASLFGKHPNGSPIEPASLCVRAPSVLEVRLPADLIVGAEFVAMGTLHPESGKEGSVQLQVSTTKPEGTSGLQPTAVSVTNANGPWTSNNRGVSHATPVIAAEGSAARRRIETSFEEFRNWFPPALCYTKIVPVDEVVTLTLFYREDDQLRRLMLTDDQIATLDQLWDELHYVSHDALALVDAYAQLMEYATQDADPKVFEPLRKPIQEKAERFREWLTRTEPSHLDALVRFAAQAYRRSLTGNEEQQLRSLYADLRKQEIPHDEAFRLTLARILVAPAFLYRVERPKPGKEQGPVSDWEMASRLSYFFWSSQPDDELRELAAAGKLGDVDTVVAQSHRLLQDPRARRLATEFACQWLHIHDFEHLDEKSERHFPTFVGLRGAMYEESILFFTDLFENNGSLLSLLDADHTFLNEELAKHYGIPGVTGPAWRRVDGLKSHARGGGILTMATTLSKQSGASRTSPILRGNWLSEVVMGEKLPRPPKNVPQLSDTVPEGLTERQLIERHSSDPACVKCHARIDPLGFALENYDAIGRFREKDSQGLAIDTRTKLQDGTEMNGLSGLQKYLLTARRDAFVRQFCRKLLGYALGRSVQLSDEPLLTKMQEDLKANNYKVLNAIDAIVQSRQFREIRGRDVADDES